MTLHYSSFTKSKNEKRNRMIKVENKKDLNKEREIKKNESTIFNSNTDLSEE